MIVADTNLIAYLLLQGEQTETAEKVLARDAEWIAPLLWRSELRNVLALHLRRQILETAQAVRLMELAETMMRGREYAVPSEPVLRLAESSRCSAYDCEFVALAMQEEIPLVTSDLEVLKAFPSLAVQPRAFLS